MEIREVTLEEVKDNTYIVDVFAKWCSPCKAILPTLEEINSEIDIEIVKLDVEKDRDRIISEFGVKNIPCLIYVENGVETKRLVGKKTKEEILDWI